MVTLYCSLHYLKGAVVKMQGKKTGQCLVLSMVMQCCKELILLREGIDSYSQRILEHSSRIAEQSDLYQCQV